VEDDWIRFLFPIAIQDYLLTSRSTQTEAYLGQPIPFSDQEKILKAAREVSADYVIAGQYSRLGPLLEITARFVDTQSGIEVGRYNGKVEFPGTRQVSDFLIELTLRSSRFFKKVKTKRGKMEVLRNETLSEEALRYFVLGSVALRRGTPEGVRESVRRFEESVRQDYNYVPAYIGLALALARQGFVETVEGMPTWKPYLRARRELEKARLLNRKMTKVWGKPIEAYLEGETLLKIAQNHAEKGNIRKAANHLSNLVEILKGDVAARETLVRYLEELGRSREAADEQRIFEQLNQCGGEG
jgi:tetratricopeptide (TPR) repeat protein